MSTVTERGIIRNVLVWFLLISPCWVTLAGCSQPTEIERKRWGNYSIETKGKRYKSQYGSRYKPQYSSNHNYESQQERKERTKRLLSKLNLTFYYKKLGLSYGASLQEIIKAYKSLARKYHPDKNLNNTEAATEEFQKISEAHTQLIDAYADGRLPATE